MVINILNTKISELGEKVFREKFIVVINAFKGKIMQAGKEKLGIHLEKNQTQRKQKKLK